MRTCPLANLAGNGLFGHDAIVHNYSQRSMLFPWINQSDIFILN